MTLQQSHTSPITLQKNRRPCKYLFRGNSLAEVGGQDCNEDTDFFLNFMHLTNPAIILQQYDVLGEIIGPIIAYNLRLSVVKTKN